VSELIPEFRTKGSVAKDSLDIYIEHRLKCAQQQHEELHGQNPGPNVTPVEAQFPSELLRRFDAHWKPRSSVKAIGIRALRADQV
jgi:hypothetical protein